MNNTIRNVEEMGTAIETVYNDLTSCCLKIAGLMDKVKKQVGYIYTHALRLSELYDSIQKELYFTDVDFCSFR